MVQKLLTIFIFLSLLISSASLSAKPLAPTPRKPKLVLMPIIVSSEDMRLRGQMETALVEGLQEKYVVFSGDNVLQKQRETFAKESKEAKGDCDQTKCMQDIAEGFGSELVAVAHVTKQDGGYFLSINIQNIFDEKVVYTKSRAYANQTAFEVIDLLRELIGEKKRNETTTFAQVVVTPNIQETISKSNTSDVESTLWTEVQSSNTVEDYTIYLDTYPKGKYITLAKARIKKLKDDAIAKANEQAQVQEQQLWDTAQNTNTEKSYNQYLTRYPNGKFTALAKVKLNKFKLQASSKEPFQDCPNCPKMINIPGGEFMMGSNESSDEKPIHRISIPAFAMGVTEVTQGEYKALMGTNPSDFSSCGDTCPVEEVSWDDATAYAQKLSTLTGHTYRLPTEAEWEYAARAGTSTKWYCGDDESCVDSIIWYKNNSNSKTHPAAQKRANAFGLYDMSGNVWEWTQDWYTDSYASITNDGSTNTTGEQKYRTLRGGSWDDSPVITRSAFRGSVTPNSRDNDVGFRILRTK